MPPAERPPQPIILASRHSARVSHAWKQWKARHDPPGMWTGFNCRDGERAFLRFGINHRALGYYELSTYEVVPYSEWQKQARVVAWSWYDRRASLVWSLQSKGIAVLQLWPAVLTFFEEQVKSCEQWKGQSDTLEAFPEVLHTLGERQGKVEPQTDLICPAVSPQVVDGWPAGSECRVAKRGRQIFTVGDSRTPRMVVLYGEHESMRMPYGRLIRVRRRTGAAEVP